MAFFLHGENQIYYMEYGSGKPIIFLHGITNSGRAWLQQVPTYVDAGFRVIVPDLTGHGGSSPAKNVTSPRDLAITILALIEFLEIEKIDICGLSLGGTVALEAALICPEKFGRLIIANSFERTNSKELGEMAEGWKQTFRKRNGPTLRLEGTWPILVNQKFRDSANGIVTYSIWHAQSIQASGESYCNITDGLAHYDLSEKLANISNSTLVISSSNDKISPLENSTNLAEKIPNSEHVTIQNSEHISNVDSAPLFNQITLEFLAK